MYRAQLESPASSHPGIGVGVDPASGHLFITITYVAFPPRIDAPAVAGCIGDAIDAVESSRVDTERSRVAQQYADGLARGAEHAPLWPQISAELASAARNRYKKSSYATAKAVDAVEIDPGKLVQGQPIDDVGVGVAQSPRYGALGGISWVVVFQAERHRSRRRFDAGPDAAARRACLAAATGRALPPSSASGRWTLENRGVAVPAE